MLRLIYLYAYTIKFLTVRQILYRVYYFIFNYQKIGEYQNKSSKVLKRSKISEVNWIIKNVTFPKNYNFNFLNSLHQVKNFNLTSSHGLSKLWLYNLHYFDYLITKDGLSKVKEAKMLITKWMQTDKKDIKIGLEPYPSSLRIVNWIKWLIITNTKDKNINNNIAFQTKLLSNKIEWHIMANHLIANAKALIFFGVFFSCKEAKKLRKKGEKILLQEIKEQILIDGGHFERSPMYHSIIIEDLIDILELNKLFPNRMDLKIINEIKNLLPKAISWLKIMSHPDNQIPFLNDSSIGIAQPPKKIFTFYHYHFPKELPCPNVDELTYNYLKSSGFFSVESKTYKCLADIGSIGPNYQPGHSHAQTFSFELSVWRQRVFVNTGISEYGQKKRRHLERSTIAHNTVVYNNKNSSEIWSGFRIAKRANVSDVNIINNKDYINISAQHDGYKNFFNNLYHKRTWEFKSKNIKIFDDMNQNANCKAILIVHPDVILTRKTKNSFQITLKNQRIIKLSFNETDIKILDWYYAPRFGQLLKTKCLHIYLKKNILKTHINW